jgi:hypothetical protein
MFQLVELGEDVVFDGFGQSDVVRRHDQFHGRKVRGAIGKIQSGLQVLIILQNPSGRPPSRIFVSNAADTRRSIRAVPRDRGGRRAKTFL